MTDLQTNTETEEPPQPEDMLYLFNMSEDVLPFIRCLPRDKQASEVAENARLSGREYLGGRAAYPGRHVTMISPSSVDLDFIDYVDDLIEGSGTVYVPRIPHQGAVCQELLEDDILFKRVIRRDYQIVSYCNSPQLYALLNAFKDAGALMRPIDIPEESEWQVVEPYGTKTGFRRLTQTLSDPRIRMSPGAIFQHYNEAVIAAASRPPQAGVVIKTHKGHAGLGVSIFPPGTLSPDESERLGQIKNRLMEDDGYWEHFDMVVEDFIPTDTAIGGGFPNIEGHIDRTGHVTINYPCGMRIIDGGVFAGVEMGAKVLDTAIIERMYEIGAVFGNVYAKAGYTGFFELDFLAGRDGQLYASESNIRRNGGTYAYQLAKYLFGAGFIHDRYIVTQYIPIQKSNLTFGQIYDATQDMQLKKGSEVGVLLTAPDALELGRLGYFIAAENRDQAIAIEKTFIQRVNEL